MVYQKAFKNILLTLVLVLCICFVPYQSAHAYNNIFDQTVTHSTLFYPWVYSDLNGTLIDTVDNSVNYNTGISLQANKYYAFNVYLESKETEYITSSSDGDILYRYYMIYAGQKFYFNSDESVLSLVIPGNDYSQVSFGCEVTYIVSPDQDYNGTYSNSANTSVSITTRVRIWELLPEEISSNDGFFVVDESIQEGNALQQESNDLQSEANDLQEEANQTSLNIFDKISEFFAGFFDNLGKSVLNWIVPTSSQITDFLNRMNAWFSDRLGFIWYPFDLAIRLVTALTGGNVNSSFGVPAFTLNILGDSYTIWEEFSFDIDAFGIFTYVRFFTSCLLVSSVVKLAIDKWDEWIGGHAG